MKRSEPPLLLVRLVGLVELAALAAAVGLVAANLVGTADETLWAAVAVLAVAAAVRFLPRRRRFPARLLLVVLVVMGVLGEVGVRLSRDALRGHLYTELPGDFVWVRDPVLRFTYRPGSPCGDGAHTVTGRRICDRPHTAEKPPGTVRIVVLGDSTSLFVDPYDDLWHQRLGRALTTDGLAVEIVNGAVEGYNARQQVAFFERFLLELDPDLVLVGYCLNDPYPDVAVWRRARSKLLRLVSLLVASIGMERTPAEDFRRLHEDPDTWGDVVTAYERLRALAAANGFAVAGFAMPVMSAGHGLDRIYPQVEALFRDKGFAALDVHAGLTEAEKRAFRTDGDELHPNAAFHARIAERLRPFLYEQGLLPRP